MKKIILTLGLAGIVGLGMALIVFWPHKRPQPATIYQKTTSPQPVSSHDACDLLTAKDAQAVLKQPMRAVDHSSNAGRPGVIIPATSCAYHSVDAHARLSLVTVTVFYADAAEKIAINKNNFVVSRNSSDIVVPNLGDAAYFVPTPGLYKLHVLKGTYHFIIDVGNDQQPLPDQTATEAIARNILAKL